MIIWATVEFFPGAGVRGTQTTDYEVTKTFNISVSQIMLFFCDSPTPIPSLPTGQKNANLTSKP